MFGFGKKYCYTCGTEVSGSQHTRFGKPFCSEEHVQQYGREMKRGRQLRLSRQFSQQKPERATSQKGSHKCC